MPWKIVEQDGEYCVHKMMGDGGMGEKVGCHGTDKEAAMAQMRVLYAKANISVTLQSSPLFVNQIREVNHGGRDYLIVTGVPARAQVMNTYLVPESDLKRSVPGWNGTPITIHHPQANGKSANVPAPDVAVIGRFYGANWDTQNKRMVGEYWIDIGEASKYLEGEAVLNKIRQGQPLETSTGYYADEESTPGEYEGRAYQTIHRNLLPDHIAILPKQAGACSLKDGCGVNVNEGEVVTNCSAECDCPFRVTNEQAYPEFQEGHLPVKMLVGYSVNKGSRTPEQLASLKNQIKENGVTKEVIVVRLNDGMLKILDGNHRVSIADELQLEQVPAVAVDEGLRDLNLQAVYSEQSHRRDQSYLNHSRASQEPALIPTQRKEIKAMNMIQLQDFLKAKGLNVSVNGEDFTVDETTPAANVGELTPEDISALKGIAALAPKLNALDANALGKLDKLDVLVKAADDLIAQQNAEKQSLIAIMVTNSGLTKEELEAMPLAVLRKLHAQSDTTYTPLGGGREITLFDNAEVLVTPNALIGWKPTEEV